MRQISSSACLPKNVKPEPPNETPHLTLSNEANVTMPDVGKEQVSDSSFEGHKEEGQEFDEDSEEEVPIPPKRKRAKRATPSKAAPIIRKVRVRGKQVRLADLIKMPIEVFAEIALYLNPKDIISLSHLNKFFNSLLMRRSALHIWRGAMRNVPSLPPCPSDMIEPRYLALIYTKSCMMCGVTVNRRMNGPLRTRLCTSCASTALIRMPNVSTEIRGLVLYSSTLMLGTGHEAWVVLRSDVKHVQTKLSELEDPQARDAWKAERVKENEERREQNMKISEFIGQMELERTNELEDMKKQHRAEVESRLLLEGWQRADLVPPHTSKQAWTKLVEQPKTVTDRTWANLKPKITPILETNRTERLKREADKRMKERRTTLAEALDDIRKKKPPIIDATICHPATTSGSTSDPTTSHVRFSGIFPDIVDAVEWQETQDLLVVDLPYAEIPIERMTIASANIVRRSLGWAADVEATLVELLRKGRVDDGLSPDIPTPTLSLAEESLDDPFKNATKDQKILLRADSLFRSPLLHRAVSYDELIPHGYLALGGRFIKNALVMELPLDTSQFKRHDVGQAEARKILEWMGKPDATFLEMNSVGSVYACGRCPDRFAYAWEQIIEHFTDAANEWNTIQAHRDKLLERDITFQNVHDLARDTDKPLVRILSKTEASQRYQSTRPTKSCVLCSLAGIEISTQGTEDGIKDHIREVHDISDPQPVRHYIPYNYRSKFMSGY